MNQQSTIEVITGDGWRKIYPLEKPIIYLGSHPRSDIILEAAPGGGIAPLHAQLIASASNGAGYQLINLADTPISLGTSGDQTIPGRSAINIADGTTFTLGQYTLIFHSSGAVGSGSSSGFYGGSGSTGGGSRYIGVSVSLPRTQLAPDQMLDGIITVSNLGEQTAAQFELELLGLDPDCYDIEPGPLLSSGAEKEVFFRLFCKILL